MSQQTQGRCHNAVTTSDVWLYRSVQFIGNQSFADVSDNVVATLRSDVVATLHQSRTNVVRLPSRF